MRYIKYILDVGYAGCNEEDVMALPDDISDVAIEANLYEALQDYAQSMEHVAEGYDWEEGWENEEDKEYYYENCNYSWEEITEEEYNEFLGIEDEEDKDSDENWDYDEEDEN